jgi:membrane protease subunit HflC
MNKAFAVIVGLLLLALLVLFSTTYTVRFHQVAVKTTFGKEETVQDTPGVHFCYPLFIDRVTKYDKRIQLVDTPLIEAPTADGQSVVVKAFLMWRIAPDNVVRFNQSFPKEMSKADRPLRDHLQTAVRAGLGQYAFDELIGTDSRLPEAEQAILGELDTVEQWGIEPVTVGISQMVLPAKTTKAVLARMEATRSQLAEAERAKGKSDAVGIRSEAKTTVEKFQAFANQRAEEIRGLGEGMAARFLAEMSENQDLAILMMNVDTLKEALSGFTTIVLTDKSEPWNLLNDTSGPPGAIAQPARQPVSQPERPRDETETPPAAMPAAAE